MSELLPETAKDPAFLMLSRTRVQTQMTGKLPLRSVILFAFILTFVASASWHSAMMKMTGYGGYSVERQIADVNGNPHGTAEPANDQCMANGQCSFTGVISGTPYIESARSPSTRLGTDELTNGRANTPEAPPPKYT